MGLSWRMNSLSHSVLGVDCLPWDKEGVGVWSPARSYQDYNKYGTNSFLAWHLASVVGLASDSPAHRRSLGRRGLNLGDDFGILRDVTMTWTSTFSPQEGGGRASPPSHATAFLHRKIGRGRSVICSFKNNSHAPKRRRFLPVSD